MSNDVSSLSFDLIKQEIFIHVLVLLRIVLGTFKHIKRNKIGIIDISLEGIKLLFGLSHPFLSLFEFLVVNLL